MRYTITGNFQYDLGIFGLKKILDFFEEKYITDNTFYFEVDKKPEEIFELVLKKLIIEKDLDYFKNKAINEIFKSDGKKDKEKIKVLEKQKETFLKNNEQNLQIRDFNLNTLKSKNLDTIVTSISEKIYSCLELPLKGLNLTFNNIQIRDVIWTKSIEIINTYFLNFQADKTTKGKKIFEKSVEKLLLIDKDSDCSFCHKNKGSTINRSNFFFAPAQLNAFWFNEGSIFICPYCIVSNFAITQSLTFLKNNQAIVIYSPNLAELETLKSMLSEKDVKDIGGVTKTIIDYEKQKLKIESVVGDLQVIEFFIDSQKPDLTFYLMSSISLEKMLKVDDILEKLYEQKNKRLYGEIKSQNGFQYIDLSEEILFHISYNQKFIRLIDKYINLVISAEIFRQKVRQNQIKENKVLVKGFYADIFLDILKIHFKLEEQEDMDSFEYFKNYGQKLRNTIYAQLIKKSGGTDILNVFNNRIISIANSFLNSSKGSFQQFAENLTRITIQYEYPINSNGLSFLNEKSYREIASLLALSVVSYSPKKDTQNNEQKEISDSIEIEENEDEAISESL